MLQTQTVTPLLLNILQKIMNEPLFQPFRLAGGTALSLQIGHRKSIDIDLFTDEIYGSIDFGAIDHYFEANFNICKHNKTTTVGFGKCYFIGNHVTELIKVDVFYSDPFIENYITLENIRLASINEIIAMKLDVIQRTGRKKDYWDLHEFIDKMTVEHWLKLHEKRYPFNHKKVDLINNLTKFDAADLDFDPICLKGKFWEFIKEDFLDFVKPQLN